MLLALSAEIIPFKNPIPPVFEDIALNIFEGFAPLPVSPPWQLAQLFAHRDLPTKPAACNASAEGFDVVVAVVVVFVVVAVISVAVVVPPPQATRANVIPIPNVTARIIRLLDFDNAMITPQLLFIQCELT
jgi:hypothetical protein